MKRFLVDLLQNGDGLVTLQEFDMHPNARRNCQDNYIPGKYNHLQYRTFKTDRAFVTVYSIGGLGAEWVIGGGR